MNVGLTLYGSLSTRSGGFRYDRRLVEGLRAAGDTVEVIELPWRSYPRGLLDTLSPGLRDRLDVDVDVMLQDELAHPSLVGTSRRLSYPVVSIVHHLRSSERRRLAPLYRAIEGRYLRGVDGAICNSTATRAAIAALSPVRTVVAPPAGDHFAPDVDERLVTERATDGPLRVAFVGTVTPRKGLLELLEALASLDADWELTALGREADAAYARSVRETVRDAGIGDRVDLLGERPDDAVAATLRESHVLAVPSRYEGFGLVYLEAMGFGLPVIGAADGGAADIVAPGETGFLVDPADRDAVSRPLARLATDRERLAEMGRAALRRYAAHPDWARTTDRVRSFLADVVADRSAEVTPA